MSINFNKNACVIDIGHGGNDSGAVSELYKEKDWNLDTGLACIEELKRHNVTVYATRTTDKTLSIEQRCNIANQYNAQYFISIHHNAGGGDRGETIHSIYGGEGTQLALNIGEELRTIGQSNIKTYDKKYGNTDYYGVIRGTKMHSVIVEVCFIDNVNDRQIADTLEERKRNGRAIAHGILKQMGISVKEQSNGIYKIVTGGFGAKENAEKKMNAIAELTGWWMNIERINNKEDYRVVTGGMSKEEADKNLEALKQLTNWWAVVEKQ